MRWRDTRSSKRGDPEVDCALPGATGGAKFLSREPIINIDVTPRNLRGCLHTAQGNNGVARPKHVTRDD